MPSYQQFDSFAGRLKNSTQFQPLFPINPATLQRTDPPTMIWDTIRTKPVRTAGEKPAAYSTIPPKLKATMEHFQKDMTKPVYLMGGTKDKVMFGIAVAGVAFLGFHCIKFISWKIYQK